MKISNWVIRRVRKVKRRSRRSKFFYKNSRSEYLQTKEKTRELVLRKIAEHNSFYNFNIGRVSIKNQKSRWGSCSKKGNLNFNYRLALVDEQFVDYVIVHELCHLEQFNHSKDFWNLVAKKIPHHKNLRKKLKQLKFKK